ncbi:hypothetical protein BVRB_5g109770 [Beta vulgaris subsp. vulgaris]|uniref:plant cysteine oxidase 1 n=1 Tax=Beta vulgaris subsp. vulgaris TaxID=3555 RepID=UPI00053FB9EC|nr:plant cysteine oxidase 1 [Beta vulgaris subsp. vulgaris]KMT11293.1 hypothetical protein BVRB_5g109770 [Beta vulgaris subsp. vulgaris]
MKMDGGLVEHRREIIGHVNGKVIKKRKVRRRSSSSSITPSKSLQRLYSFCKQVFKGPGIVPASQDVQNLCHILDSLRPEDFGLSKDLQFFKPGGSVKRNPRVTYTTVYKCRQFSLVIFFLPASAVIPLHNHPEMTVFNKLLLGEMHIKAYDWADPLDVECSNQPSSKRLARLKANSVFTAPCNTSVLYPTSGGNIHEFTAITPCAVLDILGPPYSKEDGRDCSYYKEILSTSPDEEFEELKDDEHSYGWLEEIEMPENSKMDGIEYLGPRIIETAAS